MAILVTVLLNFGCSLVLGLAALRWLPALRAAAVGGRTAAGAGAERMGGALGGGLGQEVGAGGNGCVGSGHGRSGIGRSPTGIGHGNAGISRGRWGLLQLRGATVPEDPLASPLRWAG